MRTRAIIVSAFLITIAAAATAATVEAPFTAVVIAPNTADAHVRITANPKLVATIAADVNVLCLDANNAKVTEFTTRLTRKDSVNLPWVSVLKFPKEMASRINTVRLQPIRAKGGDVSPIRKTQPAGCFGFCADFARECNWMCAFQPPPAIPGPVYYFCGKDAQVGGCHGICICGDGATLEW